METKKIVIGSDHGGLHLKANIINHLEKRGFSVTDVGTYTEDSCNYPDYADALCRRIQSGEFERGILVCGTGIGMSMAANKHSGIRAACCENTFSARMTRMHNNANVLCLGERVIGAGLPATWWTCLPIRILRAADTRDVLPCWMRWTMQRTDRYPHRQGGNKNGGNRS